MLYAAEIAKDEVGENAAHALQHEIHDRLSDAEDKLCNTRATTLDDLRCKARISLLVERGNMQQPIAQSIVDDLMAV